MTDEDLEAAVANARKTLKLAMIVLAAGAVVLLIDNGIKKTIISEGYQARAALEEARKLAGEAAGEQDAGEAGGAAGGDLQRGGGVVHAEPGGPAPAAAPGPADPA